MGKDLGSEGRQEGKGTGSSRKGRRQNGGGGVQSKWKL